MIFLSSENQLDFLLVINTNLGRILHRLFAIHPLHTNIVPQTPVARQNKHADSARMWIVDWESANGNRDEQTQNDEAGQGAADLSAVA